MAAILELFPLASTTSLTMIRIVKYLVSLVRWMALDPDLRQVFAPAALATFTVLFGVLSSGTIADGLHHSGAALQIFGTLAVAWGLFERQKLFGRRGLKTKLAHGFSRRPLWKQSTQINYAHGSSTLGVMGSAAILTVWKEAQPGDSLEARLEAIESNFTRLRDEQSRLNQLVAAERGERTEAIRQEQQARREAARAIDERLDKFGAGGLHIDAAGVFLLILGLVFSSL